MSLNTIYCFTNKINNKKYIGSTIQSDPKIRYNQHMYNARHKESIKYDYPLYQAIRKYGEENFDFEILEQIECDEDEIRKIEQKYIIKLNTLSPNGYNQTLDTFHPRNDPKTYEKMKNTKRELAKQVAEVDSQNNIIKIWRSIVDCSEQTNLGEKHIADCCRGERHSTGGRTFYWIDENNNLIIPKYTGAQYKGAVGTTQKQKTNRKVAKIDLKTKEILAIYDSIALASRENNCDPSGITKVCKGKRAYTGGFYWKYVDEE